MLGWLAVILFVVAMGITAYAMTQPTTPELYQTLFNIALVLSLAGGACIIIAGITGLK